VFISAGFYENVSLMFADRYLEKNRNPVLIHTPPHKNLGVVAVIPCYNEPDVLQTLYSLDQCHLPPAEVEVIVLINHPETAPEEVRCRNYKTLSEVETWISKNSKAGIHFFVVGPVELRRKWAGAGLARKRGMDEAVRRLDIVNHPGGVIVSLDADTLVEENYLLEIEKYFRTHPRNVGATIAFRHQTAGLTGKHLQGIALYEQYMTYYKEALGFTGYPYPMYTIGSAFAVKADAYVKRGGMNRRKAGEDFYFMQNLVQLGPVGEIHTTTVHPSARLSDRVPFGTGPVMQKWMKGEEDLSQTYNFQAFLDLRHFFSSKDSFYQITENEYQKMLLNFPLPVATFLEEVNFWQDICLLNANCSGISSFRSRFFQRFNAFKILKFLNYTHGTFYTKAAMAEQIYRMEECRPGEQL
jgi:glycosyltransferase involved in cell wall biosynthesis